jgi:uncharacterized protein YkwD
MITRKRIFIYGCLILLAAGVFYYRPYLENLYLISKNKIENFGPASLNSVANSIPKNISAPPPLKEEKDSVNAHLTQKGVIDLTNEQRKDNKQKALKENTQLDAAAEKKAKDILAKQYFEHISPEGQGPDYFVSSAGYDYITIGENLALGNFADDLDLVTAWMNSPGHRENILRSSFQEIGVAVIKGVYEGKSSWVAVQEFGTPSSVCEEADAALKSKIDGNTKEIDQMTSDLKSKKSAMDGANPRSASYGQAVDSYNALVSRYNALAGKTKDLIRDYNSEVQRYNDCIKSY